MKSEEDIRQNLKMISQLDNYPMPKQNRDIIDAKKEMLKWVLE